jgi:hypothetical protein
MSEPRVRAPSVISILPLWLFLGSAAAEALKLLQCWPDSGLKLVMFAVLAVFALLSAVYLRGRRD